MSANSMAHCFHCLQPIPEYTDLRISIHGKSRAMCCHGCLFAAQFIDEQGLGDFYQHRQQGGEDKLFAQVARVQQQSSQWDFLNEPQVAEKFISINKQGHRQISVLVQGLYCASCSWLIEKSLGKLSPNINTQIDMDARHLHLTVMDDNLSLADILSTVARLGYKPSPIALQNLSDSTECQQQEKAQYLKRLLVAGLGMMQVMMYAVASYLGDAQGMDSNIERFLRLISMLIATLVVFYSGRSFFKNAWQDVKNRHLGMDVPIALAIAGAYFPSVWIALANLQQDVYFDSAVMFVFFLLLGRFVEIRARHRLGGATTITNILPQMIKVKRQQNKQILISPQEVEIGDCVLLEPQQIIPFDGVLKNSQQKTTYLTIDESLLTGESIACQKSAGDVVYAGTRVLTGSAEIECDRQWHQSSSMQIERLLSHSSNPAVGSSLSQYTSRYFVSAVLLITIVVGIYWWSVQPERVFEIILAMLVASCPCAFSLAQSVSVTASTQRLRKAGVLLANSAILTKLQQVSRWCFDKTGTLTKGQSQIVHVETQGELSEQECLSIIASLEQDSQHSLASAFLNIGLCTQPVAEKKEMIGKGIKGLIADKQLTYCGSKAWVEESCDLTDESQTLAQYQYCSQILLAKQGQRLATVYISDVVRETAMFFLNWLKQQQQKIIVLSGDRQSAVDDIANLLNIQSAQGDCTPEDKSAYIKQCQKQGQTVVMVGDGANDAPVLACADVGIAMASGSELSQSQADVVLLNGRLDHLPLLYKVAQKSQHITKQNMLWAIGYNMLALPLAASGYLTPWLAALGMSLSSLLVVLNALRISCVN